MPTTSDRSTLSPHKSPLEVIYLIGILINNESIMSYPSQVCVMEIRCICLTDAIQVTQQTREYNIERIIQKYSPVIRFKVKKSLGGRTPDWEDVAHEIILNVVEKLKRGEFRGESSIGTYIYTITQRRIVDYIRKKSRVLSHAPEPTPFISPEERMEERQRATWLAQAIQQLKPKYREVLYLYYYKELSREEVALRLKILPRQVSERVNYAQKLLKKTLKR